MRLRLETKHRIAGYHWYRNARAEIYLLCANTGAGLIAATGVVAALSPRLHWSRNIAVAQACLLRQEKPSGVLGTTWRKACHIRDTGLWGDWKLSAPKTDAFFWALSGYDSAVVIDTWMLRWLAPKLQGAKVRAPLYRRLAARVKRAAARYGMTPRDFQAAAWLAIRDQAKQTKTYRKRG